MKVKIKAAPGVQVPREDSPRRYITETEPFSAELTAYYRRQIAAGDLVIIDETAEASASTVTEEPSALPSPEPAANKSKVKSEQTEGTDDGQH
ncbi:hypothetical protein EHW64_13600 [Erwinia psidii]|uniref:hypothetical protein n=1 Tax=Erwinia psidii TaxID=69224 RepID=UPI00226B3B9F|nr:hypothetical protein [Erwinia psidii]MCX8962137.1 hypothetical protein [Erwinia psidii]